MPTTTTQGIMSSSPLSILISKVHRETRGKSKVYLERGEQLEETPGFPPREAMVSTDKCHTLLEDQSGRIRLSRLLSTKETDHAAHDEEVDGEGNP